MEQLFEAFKGKNPQEIVAAAEKFIEDEIGIKTSSDFVISTILEEYILQYLEPYARFCNAIDYAAHYMSRRIIDCQTHKHSYNATHLSAFYSDKILSGIVEEQRLKANIEAVTTLLPLPIWEEVIEHIC